VEGRREIRRFLSLGKRKSGGRAVDKQTRGGGKERGGGAHNDGRKGGGSGLGALERKEQKMSERVEGEKDDGGRLKQQSG